MIPSLARRGVLVLAAATAFLTVAALYHSPPLAALGAVVVSALLTAYLWFFPTAILLRRRKIELSWWVPPGDQPGGALATDRPFLLHVALRNHGLRRLRVLALEVYGSSALDLPRTLEAVVPAGHQVEIAGEVRARAAGYQVLHGAVLRFGDVLGLFEVQAYFPNPIAIKVFPRVVANRAAGLRPRGGATVERVGLHQVRRRGLAGELREIRDHNHGDPFKFIAWKATARRQKLMVRDLESEIVLTHQLLVDIGGSMRAGPPGRSQLDWAIETATGLARLGLDGGDRVGLVTFDTRVYAELKPGDGHHHYLKLVDRLLETHNVVDEDLTDLTAGELVSAVARYLAHQEAIDVRIRRPPPLDDPAWEKIQAGPSGELYDIAALDVVIGTLLRSMGQAAETRSLAPAWWWARVQVGAETDPQMARLRLFCRLRGLELPFRLQHEHGQRAAGWLEAVRRATHQGRADAVIVISDLAGLAEDPEGSAAALGLARRRGSQVVVLVPSAPAFVPTPLTEVGGHVLAIARRDEHHRLERGRRSLLRHGIPVLPVGPEDSLPVLLGRMARSRGARRVA